MVTLYDELAPWWRLLSDPADYEEEAGFYRDTLEAAYGGGLRTLLELGSGGGNNAFHLKNHFDLTLVDLAEGMLQQSLEINPECAHALGDMRSVRLGTAFDAVFIHDAIVYMTTVDDLRRAIETAFFHCKPGGVALFTPDHVLETFEPETAHGGCDSEGRAMRYLEWSWDPDPDDTEMTVDYAFLLREEDGSARAVHDRHVEGLFPRQTWLDLLEEVGFEARAVTFHHTGVDRPMDGFVGRRPGS